VRVNGGGCGVKTVAGRKSGTEGDVRKASGMPAGMGGGTGIRAGGQEG